MGRGKSETILQLKQNFIFAVIRADSEESGYEICKSVFEGGIKNIEVTFSTPGAERVINRLVKDFADTDMLVGAGTVMDEITARIAVMNGADFLVSPHFSADIAAVCNRYAIPYLPGCGSVTEVATALEHGSEILKIFPGGVLGPAFIKDVHGPMPYAQMMPSGGVSIDNMGDWIKSGACAVGVGSALTKRYKAEGPQSVREISAAFAAKLKEYK
ncbi:MAG TPA: bifunctional 2-keto-4-hydroxyglutarate aldolase/2-keto-3-deoxy-6-phosphogluconate aldolase [Candidatus Egerieimonas intestinavium]|uniref:Bifunctional 2-keto-4-hydroxyglutarate aldolase/2-keto-3-deoxy-6-phosphogluconate aldolase n=1 Tax=Candidatus Egerieimonas intestinavium TaxID=2840777 RepID=A0A9D1JGY6_9FIRM|nr:bifunctional 2-keto-4-hydroxyglutarate aldolase/2-keto-3-deoxy-6-phosphogluconate aldolase [Candidatus Egerieimonas intestinavium]